jgi:putative MATE family efflux protein
MLNPPALTSPPLWKTFLAFLIPMMLSNVLQSLFGTFNNIYLGQMIGVDALAAASLFFPVMFFLVSFVIGLGIGATMLIGQAWGAGERDKIAAIAGTTFTVCLLFGVVVATAGGLFSRPLMVMLAAPVNILDEASHYARIMLIAMPLTFLFIIWTSMMRGVGDTVTPLLALAVSTAIGLALTPALIGGWFGLPKLNIASAAWASAISSLVTLIGLGVYLNRKRHPLAFSAAFLTHLRPNPALLGKILRIGFPAAVGMVAMSLAELVLLGLVNGHGSNATAAYGAVNQAMAYVQFPAMSIGIAVSILSAQTIGAGRADRVNAVVRTGLMMNLVLTGSLVALTYLFSRAMMGLFITDPAVLDLAQDLLHIVSWSSVVFGMSLVFSNAMRASGTAFAPMLLSLVAIVGIEIPTAVILNRYFGLPGIWIAYAMTFCVMCILQMSYYHLVWKKQRIERLI